MAAMAVWAGFPFRAIERKFDFNRPPQQFLSVQLPYGLQGIRFRFHGYKTKSPGISR